MKRWTAGLAAAAACAALASGAGPALAQQPGSSGERAYVFEDTYFDTTCLRDTVEGIVPAGGLTWARGGGTLAITATATDELGQPVEGPQAYVLGTAPCTQLRRLGPVDADTTGSFSPDGTQIAVQRRSRIVVLDVATGAVVRDLTAGRDPSWDPTGKGIAYRASDGIRVRPPTGGSSRLFKSSASAPDYSPDGTRIGYLQGGKIKHASASTGTGTVTTPISALDFAWSPDGRSFLFLSPNHQVVVARTTGYITERLTEGSYQTHPAWQPLG